MSPLGLTRRREGGLNARSPPPVCSPCRSGLSPGLTTPRPGPGGRQLLDAEARHCGGLPTTLFTGWSHRRDCQRTEACQLTSGLAPGHRQLSGAEDADKGIPMAGAKREIPTTHGAGQERVVRCRGRRRTKRRGSDTLVRGKGPLASATRLLEAQIAMLEWTPKTYLSPAPAGHPIHVCGEGRR